MTPATAIGYLEWMRREPEIKPEFDEALRTAIQALKASAVNPVKARYDAQVVDFILSDECAMTKEEIQKIVHR